MFSHVRRHILFYAVYFGLGMIAHAGLTSYTDRGKTDFDTALERLNPYGTWSKIDEKWAFTPLDHQAPYTNGRWIYTEYGWCWKGSLPHSWVTEHYGYWKRGADRVWSWYPGPYWLPQIVEIRSTSTHIGWRSAAVDDAGDFIEQPAERYAKTDEWTFVTLARFANPVTPDLVARPDEAARLLEDSVASRHTYVTYREIDRPGPHPADFVALCRDGGMFAPKTLQDEVDSKAKTSSPDQDAGRRRVKYWITMSLPAFWTNPPPEAKPEEIYLYRPDFYQDEDGIARRISLWFDPGKLMSARQSLSEILGGGTAGKPDGDVPAAPSSHNPFRIPLDDTVQPEKAPASATNTNAANAPIPPPFATNTSPMNPHP